MLLPLLLATVAPATVRLTLAAPARPALLTSRHRPRLACPSALAQETGGEQEGIASAALSPPSASSQIVSFALPVLGACLAEPLLSMIDTICVGRLSATGASASLAALGVNAAIFNVVACSTAFLCTASTAVIGSLRPPATVPASPDSPPPPSGASRAFSDGMFLAVALGFLIGAATQLACGPLLSRFYHLEPGSPVFYLASSYLRIRSLAAPAATSTLVGAGVAFGLGDARTPLLAVVVALLVNLSGDILLIPKMGLAGAALATAVSTWAGALTLGGALAARLKPEWRVPAPQDVAPFLRVSAVLLAGTTLAALSYACTTSAVAASRSLSQIAAHQVALQSWWLLSFFSVPLSLAGQSLLPSLTRASGPAAWRMCRALLSLGAAAALPLALANALLCTRLAPALASDPTVAAQLRTVAWPAALSQLSINLATALDGAYIGCGRLGHYVRVMAAASAALGAVFVAAWATGRPGLGAAWTALAVFASVRCVAHLAGLVALRAELVGGKRQPGAVGGRPAR